MFMSEILMYNKLLLNFCLWEKLITIYVHVNSFSPLYFPLTTTEFYLKPQEYFELFQIMVDHHSGILTLKLTSVELFL